jgi:hypothetical protein
MGSPALLLTAWLSTLDSRGSIGPAQPRISLGSSTVAER